ncbi:MAG: hypothetical protein AAGJ81_08690 [Verrucomicrobiota bacterium]
MLTTTTAELFSGCGMGTIFTKQLRLPLFAAVAIAAFASNQSYGIIDLIYNNVTGEYFIKGADAGPGLFDSTGTPGYEYSWEFAPSPALRAELDELFKELNDDFALEGTAGGARFDNFDLFDISTKDLVFKATETTDRGVPATLTFDTKEGSIVAGIWDFPLGTYVGVPTNPDPTTTDPFNIQIVPEPDSFGVLLGMVAISFVSLRRRLVSRNS